GALANRRGVPTQPVKNINKTTPEFFNAREGVLFASTVYEDCVIAGFELHFDQLENPGRSVQQRIKSPSTGDVVGLQFPNEVREQCLPVGTRNTGSGPTASHFMDFLLQFLNLVQGKPGPEDHGRS